MFICNKTVLLIHYYSTRMGCNGTSNEKGNAILNIDTYNIIWMFWTKYFIFLLLSLLPVGVGIFGTEDTEIKLFFENSKHSQNKVVIASLHAFYNALMHFSAIATNFLYTFKKKHK